MLFRPDTVIWFESLDGWYVFLSRLYWRTVLIVFIFIDLDKFIQLLELLNDGWHFSLCHKVYQSISIALRSRHRRNWLFVKVWLNLLKKFLLQWLQFRRLSFKNFCVLFESLPAKVTIQKLNCKDKCSNDDTSDVWVSKFLIVLVQTLKWVVEVLSV